jgi:glycogen operon protein
MLKYHMENAGLKKYHEPNGQSYPIGATIIDGGVNFSIFSKYATWVTIAFFDHVDDVIPSRTLPLDPRVNKTYHYWHVFVPGIKKGQLYAYYLSGPYDPAAGHRFDVTKPLLDPYGKAVALPHHYNRNVYKKKGEIPKIACLKNVVADNRQYDWEDDFHPRRPFSQTVIYEMHVAGFTKSPSSGVPAEKRGTYSGLIEKIPYLQNLGITAVELLPVFQFDPQDAPEGRLNYWGYSPLAFFAPHQAYSSNTSNPLHAIDEFRDMVKALHKAGIEVILDVVFNHSSEGSHDGPTYSFRGIDNQTYYTLEADKSKYANFSGTGNTLNANQPIVRRMIIDSLRYWVREMHVDGFRFDLASILSRDEKGNPLENPPVLWDIESDPVLAGTKLMAEAWDAAGLYQVGSFVGDSWKEWNGKFRDDIRRFLIGENQVVSSFASRMLGSPDVYGHQEREPEQSINFVTCHDGFTLLDLFSYNEKHNEANGENNRDGENDNHCWNHGVEGTTDDPVINELRLRQCKNAFALTLLAIGAPMFLMGDEVGRTQQGNNNAYCQDNEISWFDWTLVEKNAGLLRFVRKMIASRLQRDAEQDRFAMSLMELLRHPILTWHGTELNQPDWGEMSHCIAFTVQNISRTMVMYYMVNAYWEEKTFALPEEIDGKKYKWRRWLDTSLPSPDDITDMHSTIAVDGFSYKLPPRTVVALVAG